MCEMGTAADDQVLLLFFSRSHGYFFQGFCERARAPDQSDPDERHHDGDPAIGAANLNPIGKDKNRIGTRTDPIRPTSPDSD